MVHHCTLDFMLCVPGFHTGLPFTYHMLHFQIPVSKRHPLTQDDAKAFSTSVTVHESLMQF